MEGTITFEDGTTVPVTMQFGSYTITVSVPVELEHFICFNRRDYLPLNLWDSTPDY